MMQSANKRTLLGIDAFWDKPAPYPPLRWEKWRVQYKLALHAKKMLSLILFSVANQRLLISHWNSFTRRPLSAVLLNLRKNGTPVMHNRKWIVGIMFGDKPCQLADRKAVSLLYLGIGVEGQTTLNCKNSHLMIDASSASECWKTV